MAASTKKTPATAGKSVRSAKKPGRSTKKSAGRGSSEASQEKHAHQDGKVARPGTGKRTTTAKPAPAVASQADSPGRRRTGGKSRSSSATTRVSPDRLTSSEPKARSPRSRKAESNGHPHPAEGQHAAPEQTADQLPATRPASTVAKRAGNEREAQVRHGLFEALDGFVSSHRLGRVVAESRFDWGEVEEPGLDPDLAFVSYDRFASYRTVPTHLTWHVVPDLVVEIVRESEETTPINRWIEAYFRAGVRRVWVVYPEQLKVHDHVSPTSSRVIDRSKAIEGSDVLPGFQFPLRDLEADSGE